MWTDTNTMAHFQSDYSAKPHQYEPANGRWRPPFKWPANNPGSSSVHKRLSYVCFTPCSTYQAYSIGAFRQGSLPCSEFRSKTKLKIVLMGSNSQHHPTASYKHLALNREFSLQALNVLLFVSHFKLIEWIFLLWASARKMAQVSMTKVILFAAVIAC